MKRLLIFLIVITLLLGIPSAVYAEKPSGEPARLNQALVLAANNHLSNQGTYGTISHTWEWVIGSGVSAWNQPGIGATGLLAAYERTGNTAYLNGAIATGDMLIVHYDSITTRPYSQDVEFLASLAVDSEDTTYADKAAEYYSRVTNEFTAVENADRYIDNRKSLAGWDLASQIRAALAVGETDYAAGMAARVVERRADWEGVLLGGWDYTLSGYASLLWSFAELGDNDLNAYLGEIKTTVLSVQGTDGSWDSGDYQTTAYAIIGLAALRVAKGAQSNAWAFIRDNMTEYGGWSYPPEYGEVNSEVIMAIGNLDVKGLKAGHVDPQPEHGDDYGTHKLDPMP